MKLIKLFFIMSFVGVFHLADAQTPQEMMDSFFKTYEEDKPVEALDELYSHTPWLESVKSNVEKLKMQFKDLKSVVGSYNGYELLYKKEVKGCLVLATYLVKFDRQPIRFNFQFYKPKDKWIIYSFSYDDSFDDDLEEAIKAEILELTK